MQGEIVILGIRRVLPVLASSLIIVSVAHAQTGSIYVTSQPPGAEVILDGNPTGLLTPALLNPVPITPTRVSVTSPGLMPSPGQELLWIMDGLVSVAHFEMEPVANLIYEAGPGCTPISIGDVVFGELDTTWPDLYCFTHPGGDLEIEVDSNDRGSYFNGYNGAFITGGPFVFGEPIRSYQDEWNHHVNFYGLPAGTYEISLSDNGVNLSTPNNWYYLGIKSGATGSLKVLTDGPGGEEIILDGAPTGIYTPATLTGLSPDIHEVELDSPGYHSIPPVFEIDVSSFHEQTLEFVMKPGDATKASDLVGCLGKNQLIYDKGTDLSLWPQPVNTYCVDMQAGESLRLELWPMNAGSAWPSVFVNFPAGVDSSQTTLGLPFSYTVYFDTTGIYNIEFGVDKAWYYVRTELITDRRLFVDSSPPGAEIIIDGVPSGRFTPDTVSDLNAGPHSVTLDLAGYYSVPDVYEIEIAYNGVVTAELELFETGVTSGEIAVTSFPETSAEIWIDGIDTGLLTPSTVVDLGAGPHTVEIKKAGKYAYPPVREVRVISGKTSSAQFNLLDPGACNPGMSLSRVTDDFLVSDVIATDEQYLEYVVTDDTDRATVLVYTNVPGEGNRMFGRTFDSNGNPLTPDFRLDTTPWFYYNGSSWDSDLALCRHPLLNPLNSLEFVSMCVQRGQMPTNYHENFTLQFADFDGNITRPPIRVDASNIAGEDWNFSALGSSSSGNLFAVWAQIEPTFNTTAIHTRAFANDGTPLGPPRLVAGAQLAQRGDYACFDVSTGNSNIMVVWHDMVGGAAPLARFRVRGQVFDDSGASVSKMITFNQDEGTGPCPKVTSLSDDSFMVAWGRHDKETDIVLAQKFDPVGNKIGPEITVAQFPYSQYNGARSVLEGPDGNVWFFGSAFGWSQYWVRRIKPDGTPLGKVEVINYKGITSTIDAYGPAFLSGGRLMIPFMWGGPFGPAGNSGISLWEVCPADWDGDGLNDYDETETHGTDPALFDTDGDFFSDGDEIMLGTDPLDPASFPPSPPLPPLPITTEVESGGCGSCSMGGEGEAEYDPVLPLLFLMLAAGQLLRKRSRTLQ